MQNHGGSLDISPASPLESFYQVFVLNTNPCVVLVVTTDIEEVLPGEAHEEGVVDEESSLDAVVGGVGDLPIPVDQPRNASVAVRFPDRDDHDLLLVLAEECDHGGDCVVVVVDLRATQEDEVALRPLGADVEGEAWDSPVVRSFLLSRMDVGDIQPGGVFFNDFLARHIWLPAVIENYNFNIFKFLLGECFQIP